MKSNNIVTECPFKLSLIVSVLALFFGCTSAPRPNILWISVEDMSPRLGAYGDPSARTPAIDQLAQQGMRFTNAFTTAGVCAPSRSAIITGMYQNSIGTHHMRTTHVAEGLPTPYLAVPPPEVKTFTEYLRAIGYYCTNNSKTDYQFGDPLTAWDESSRSAHWRNREEGQPFFSVFNFTTTHESQVWPKPDQVLQTDPASLSVPPYYPDSAVVREDLARHYDNIARVDQQVGEVLAQLETDGLSETTVVFFWSDHGDGLPRAKRWLYDSGTCVPLIIRWPGELNPGSVNEDLVSLVDLAPTLLSIAGIPVPEHLQGQAFLGPQSVPAREYVFGARDRIDESYDWVRSVRDKRYRLIRNLMPENPYILPVAYRDRGQTMQELLRLASEDQLEGPQRIWFRTERPYEELYDLKSDPHEIENMIDSPEMEETAKRLRSALDQWIQDVSDLGSLPEAEMVSQMWPANVQPTTDPPLVNPFGGQFSGSTEVTLACPTEGASIAYTVGRDENSHWHLYTNPITLHSSVSLRVKAIRYGYRESDEVAVDFLIGSQSKEPK